MKKMCDYEDCTEQATVMAAGRDLSWKDQKGHGGVGHYCITHAKIVEREGGPEYIETCPNCGCRFGVN